MTDLNLGTSGFSIQYGRPTTAYGQLSLLALTPNMHAAMLRTSLAGIPKDATILSAFVDVWQDKAVAAGSYTLTLYRIIGGWPSSVTWATAPAYTMTGAVAVTKANPAAGTQWSFDVTAMVQSFVSGITTNVGWMLMKTSATSTLVVRGVTSTSLQPRLRVVYTMAPPTPTNLKPSSGAVSIARPTLSFSADDDIEALNIQIDPAANPGTAFDTGTVPATGGLLDLTQATPGGTYAGLANSSSTSWRVRQKNAYDWSPWSSWAVFSRTNKSALTITSPSTSTIEDGTPPVTWTFAGPQVSWRARFLDSTGRVLSDSGWQNGGATSWTPTRGLTINGQAATIEVSVRDSVTREATPADPPETVATKVVSLALSGSVPPMATLNAVQDGVSPMVTLTGTRANVPDQVQVFVNGVRTATYVGTDVFTGTSFSIPDVSAPMNRPAIYRVAPVVGTAAASGGPTETITPRCQGIWLFDEADHDAAAAIWTDEQQEQSTPEVAIEHRTISEDGAVQVVRRRLVKFPPEGAISGTVLDALSVDAAECEANLRAWQEYDAGHLFRLVLGDMNRTVIIGNLDLSETPLTSAGERVLDVDFNWWSQT